MVGGPFATAITNLLIDTWQQLGRPRELDFVDIGAGDGDLLLAVNHLWHRWQTLHSVGGGVELNLVGIDLRPRPAHLPAEIRWLRADARAAAPAEVRGVICAVEVLDDVPCLSVVDGGQQARDWLVNWHSPAESLTGLAGYPRDQFAQQLRDRLVAGRLVLIDYFTDGAVTGPTAFLNGRERTASPDLPGNLTAPVYAASVIAALKGEPSVAESPLRSDDSRSDQLSLVPQSDALHRWVRNGPYGGPTYRQDPLPQRLRWASQWRELVDSPGLGDHGWIVVNQRLDHLAVVQPTDWVGCRHE